MGLIILIDNSGSDPIGELMRYLDNFREVIHETSAVIAITHTDTHPEPNVENYHHYLHECGIELPVFAVDARCADSVVMLIQALLAMLEFG
ncbi:hypothetical protein [Thioflexithrix psekupsensis]|uniref:hypothetical protein n=1 Tax=Thioflexithrix psekupsensis TaxID=1570016 RepID=UPI001FDA473A|nr:hypothetical protein [Thioflexithrix psekupsensis]